jgi:hypothetical protein
MTTLFDNIDNKPEIYKTPKKVLNYIDKSIEENQKDLFENTDNENNTNNIDFDKIQKDIDDFHISIEEWEKNPLPKTHYKNK